jgi:Fic family protein
MKVTPPNLPLPIDIETKAVLKKAAAARAALAEMKGVVASIPNEKILINTLALQEAKDSSAIENIVTTHDDLFRADVLARKFRSIASKEVHFYTDALLKGFGIVKERGLLLKTDIIQIQVTIEENNAGFRRQAGTTLKNDQTGEIVYTPPQSYDEILDHMTNLERFINDDELCDWDPLVKMAVIHHQFESIHPFYDGNGRTGRIINILYLVKEGLLNLPILYLSRYINQNKGAYYNLLQKTRTEGSWEEWVLFMLDGVEKTALQNIDLIRSIKSLMAEVKRRIKTDTNIYSHELINNIFRHPYTQIKYAQKELGVTRLTATRHLEELVALSILQKEKMGKENYYINKPLFRLLTNLNAL